MHLPLQPRSTEEIGPFSRDEDVDRFALEMPALDETRESQRPGDALRRLDHSLDRSDFRPGENAGLVEIRGDDCRPSAERRDEGGASFAVEERPARARAEDGIDDARYAGASRAQPADRAEVRLCRGHPDLDPGDFEIRIQGFDLGDQGRGSNGLEAEHLGRRLNRQAGQSRRPVEAEVVEDPDVGEDAVYFNNPDLPETRSEMALPLMASGEVIGALDIQSIKPNAFSQQDTELFLTLADQVAVGIVNSRLFDDTQKALDEAQEVQRLPERVGEAEERGGPFAAAGEEESYLAQRHQATFRPRA